MEPQKGSRSGPGQGRSTGMEDYAHAVADFVRDHQAWAAPIVLLLAFGESLAFISLLIPAWGALVAIGALIGVSGISFWPLCIAGALGAALGDWVSYWFGYRYKDRVAQMWPLSRYPEILPRGEAFVRRWGVPSIFIGRFFGPLRASVPLAAGIFEMPYWTFQIANFVSAFIWAAALLIFGDVIAQIMEWLWRVFRLEPCDRGAAQTLLHVRTTEAERTARSFDVGGSSWTSQDATPCWEAPRSRPRRS